MIMNLKHLSTAGLIAGSLGLAGLASADFAFDSFSGNGLGYNLEDGWAVAGTTGATPGVGLDTQFATEQIADEFASAVSGALNEIDLAVGVTTPDPGSGVVATLYTDSGSDTLGTALGSWSGGTQLVSSSQSGSVLAFNTAGSGINLTQGGKYWVMVSGASQDTLASWGLANTAGASQHLLIRNGATDHYESSDGLAFRVNTAGPPPTATPEPITAGLSLAGLAMAGLRIARRRRA